MGVTALVFNGLPAAAAAAVTASLALLMVGAMLLLTAYVKLQQGEVIAAEILCNAGVVFLTAALTFLPGVTSKLVQLFISLFGGAAAYKGCSLS